MKFKIGDIIKPKEEQLRLYSRFFSRFPPEGKVIAIIDDGDSGKFPVIELDNETHFTVNPDVYEIAEAK